MGGDHAVEGRYDVVIVGGRPAGASLAARLGAQGRSVLVVDKAQFPAPPSVPSCPIMYPAAMQLVDELGVEESAYGCGATKLTEFVIEFGTHFDSHFRMISSRGRDYVYGIDRAHFDHVLWTHLERYPSVTTRQGFAFTDLVREEGGRVIGIEGRSSEGPTERILAGCVVGADGRFSLVARKAGAKITEDRAAHQSTVYFADWEGLLPYGDERDPKVHIHVTGRGADVLHLPMPGGRTTVVTHMRADRVDTEGDAEAFYLGVLRSHARVHRRLAGARRVTDVIGMKRVANRYLDHGGPGWVLVGDAVHHKDPVDGQGIYDALIEAKILAEAIGSIHDGKRSFDGAIAWYGRRVLEETHPMFLATMDRLKRELYDEPPELVIRTMIRWLVNDPEYKERFLRFLCREIPPEGWLPPSLIRGAALRGAAGDLRRLVQQFTDRGGRPRADSGGAAGRPASE